MDSGIIQFPSYLPEVSYSSNHLDPETDLMDYFSDSPLFSPSCHLDLLRLSSESDDCLEIHQSPVCPSMLGLAVTDNNTCTKDGQIQEHQGKVSFDSSNKVSGKFLFEMEITNRKVAIKSSQDSETSKISHGSSINPNSKDRICSNFNQPTEKLTSKEGHSGKDPRAPRRDFVISEVKEREIRKVQQRVKTPSPWYRPMT